MNNLTPEKIKTEEVSNLVWIIHSRTNFWENKTKIQARKELKRRKIKSSDINDLLIDFNNWSTEEEKEWEKIYLETVEYESVYDYNNKFSFTIFEKFLIIITAPISFRHRIVEPSLYVLYRDKKTKLLVEKIILLTFGILLWIGIANISFELSEKKRMKEIEKIDISDWEKENGYK